MEQPPDKPPPPSFPLRRFAARERAGRIFRWLLAIAGLTQLVRYLKPAITQNQTQQQPASRGQKP